jgi:hypothetical protein
MWSSFSSLVRLWMRKGPVNFRVIPPMHPFITEGKPEQVVVVIDLSKPPNA